MHVIGRFRKASECGFRYPRCVVFSLAAVMQGRAFVAMHAYRRKVHVRRSGNHLAWDGHACSPPHRYLLRVCTVRVGERAAHRRRCPLTIALGDAEATAALRRTGNVDLSRCCLGYDFGDHSGGYFGDCVGGKGRVRGHLPQCNMLSLNAAICSYALFVHKRPALPFD